jgi:hypothetical protein
VVVVDLPIIMAAALVVGRVNMLALVVLLVLLELRQLVEVVAAPLVLQAKL